jgi:Flp pilus assembly protein TadD
LLVATTIVRNTVYQTEVAFWSSAVEMSPAKRRVRLNLAHAMIVEGERTHNPALFQQALVELQKIPGLPDDGTASLRDIYGALGMALYSLGRTAEAVKTWEEALTQYPNDDLLECNLAHAFLEQGNYSAAYAHAMSAKRFNPRQPDAARLLGLIALERGENLAAADYFLEFESLKPEDASGYWNAALAYAKAGQPQKARELCRVYLSRETEPELRSTAEAFLRDISTDIRN